MLSKKIVKVIKQMAFESIIDEGYNQKIVSETVSNFLKETFGIQPGTILQLTADTDSDPSCISIVCYTADQNRFLEYQTYQHLYEKICLNNGNIKLEKYPEIKEYSQVEVRNAIDVYLLKHLNDEGFVVDLNLAENSHLLVTEISYFACGCQGGIVRVDNTSYSIFLKMLLNDRLYHIDYSHILYWLRNGTLKVCQ